jgi:hypothetical protein
LAKLHHRVDDQGRPWLCPDGYEHVPDRFPSGITRANQADVSYGEIAENPSRFEPVRSPKPDDVLHARTNLLERYPRIGIE